jgi:hypothetical protein
MYPIGDRQQPIICPEGGNHLHPYRQAIGAHIPWQIHRWHVQQSPHPVKQGIASG